MTGPGEHISLKGVAESGLLDQMLLATMCNNTNVGVKLRLALENGLTMFRYLFAHETAFGLLTLAGVPNPNHYGIITIILVPNPKQCYGNVPIILMRLS